MTAAPLLSVVIPTKNRSGRLKRTLEVLAEQEDLDLFEVVVADNGSSDATPEVLRKAISRLPLDIIPVLQPVGGPASARNAAIAAAHGDLVLLLGDDVEPKGKSLVKRHIELHRAANNPLFAVLGKMVWDESKEVTDFMRWLDSGGPQFHYFELSPGPVMAGTYFYSSHLSLSKVVLDEYGGFDERFPYAALEDTELGSRLEKGGLNLVYHPELVVIHDHPTTFDSSLDRMERVGRSTALFNEIRPHEEHHRVGQPSGAKQFLASIGAAPLAKLGRLQLPSPLKELVWHYSHLFRLVQGYRKGPPERTTTSRGR